MNKASVNCATTSGGLIYVNWGPHRKGGPHLKK